MNSDDMGRKIDSAQQRLDFLLEQDQTNLLQSQPEIFFTVLEELSISLEELHVQHQEILETRQLLELERQRYQELFDLAPDSYFLTDSQGIIQKINYATELLFNTSSNFIIGKPLANFVAKSDREKFRSQLNQLKNSLQLKDWELILNPYQLSEFPASISVSTVRNYQGKVEGFRWQIRDLISCKQTEFQLTEAKERAEAANLAKESFLAVASHEIRTPMTGILGFCSLLLNSELSTKQKTWVETINNNANGLLNIINDILDFVKIETGKLELENEPFNLNNCIQESLNLVSLEAEKKGLLLITNLADDLPIQIKGDRQKLKQILINLLNNSIKFTDKGNIRLSVQTTQKSDKITLEFAIKDTGIGIPYNRLYRLFKPFSQIDSSTARRYGGTGLGLAICQKLVQNMGGQIWVNSKVNHGSTFYFSIVTEVSHTSFLVCDSQQQEELKNIPSVNLSQKSLNILLAEDEDSISSLLLCLFSEMGIKVDIVKNGQEAVEAFEKKEYDVVFMDLQMPIMDGLKATCIIREQEQKKQLVRGDSQLKTKIIGLTANSLPESKENCLKAGMDDYISKPFDLQNFIDLIQTL